MVQIPENEVSEQDLATWYAMQDQLSKLKIAEMLLRQKIFKAYFTAPTEGVNSAPLANGWVIKGTYKIDRKIDMALLTAFTPALRENGINPDHLIKYEPSLVTKEYRQLTAEQEKLFDQVLIVKPGAPSLEIVMPKRKG